MCRAGVAAGCADMTGSATACAEIEDMYEAVAGEPAPWVAGPPVTCPCDYAQVAKTVAVWTALPAADRIYFACPAGATPSALFQAWDGSTFFVGPPWVGVFNPGAPDPLCSWNDPLNGTFDTVRGLTAEEIEACRQDVIDYGTAFIALDLGVPVDDLCTGTL